MASRPEITRYVHARRPELNEEHAGHLASALILRYGAGQFWRDAVTGDTQGSISDEQFETVAAER